MKKIFDDDNIRKGPHHYKNFFKSHAFSKNVLDVSCGGGVTRDTLGKEMTYYGVDIDARNLSLVLKKKK